LAIHKRKYGISGRFGRKYKKGLFFRPFLLEFLIDVFVFPNGEICAMIKKNEKEFSLWKKSLPPMPLPPSALTVRA
jgi:hypothetical protein